MTLALTVADITPATDHLAPAPFKTRLGPYEGRNLGDALALRQLGAHMVTLPPGSQSALRHWHTHSEEFLYLITGELTLITNEGNSPVTAGQCLGFHAGIANGHHLANQGTEPATFLVIGTRVPGDDVVYPDDDLRWRQDSEGNWQPQHKDGRAY